MTDLPSALYLPTARDVMLPTALTAGPWRADHQHGGPPSALLGYLTEQVVDDGEVVARVSVELLRGVPISPLRTTVTRTSTSRRVHHTVAELWSGDTLVARSRALLLTGGALPEPQWTPLAETVLVPPPSATAAAPSWSSGDGLRYHTHGTEHRFTDGGFEPPGPAHDWVRLVCPVVDGIEPSGLQRALAAADFGSGVSSVYGREASFGMINADLVVAMYRQPEGEWISLETVTHLGPDGTGQGIAQLGDRGGRFGVSTQSLLGTGALPPGSVAS